MKAILLAAGLGTRLRPITDTIPKCMVNINGKPLLEYWFNLLDSDQIDDIFINTHYLSHLVEEYCTSNNSANKIRLIHEATLLGTGGTLLRIKNLINDKPFLMAHADNLSKFDVDDFISAHHKRPSGTEITMMTFITDDPSSCGILQLNEKGVATEMFEKIDNAPGNIANAAVYIMQPSVLAFLKSLNKEYIDFSTDVLPFFMGKINTYLNDSYHRDIGTPKSLELACRDMKSISDSSQ